MNISDLVQENLPQLASSLPSQQSISPSQRKFLGMQRFLSSHWWSQSLTHPSSSERSWHWGTPSHTWLCSMHFFLWPHWNWSAEDTWPKYNSGFCYVELLHPPLIKRCVVVFSDDNTMQLHIHVLIIHLLIVLDGRTRVLGKTVVILFKM